MSEEILKLNNLSVSYGDINILKNIDLSVNQGQIIGIVGESGSGKCTLIKSIIGLLDNGGSIESGNIIFKGRDITSLSLKEYREIRGENISMIFQNPSDFFNPIRKISKQFIETIRSHKDISKDEVKQKTLDIFKFLGLSDGDRVWNSYPFELSGGMNQRVAIALSIMLEPSLILADEPTSSLDVTVQAQVVKALIKMKEKLNTSIILVSHNIGLVSYLADNIGVMYGGKIIEYGDSSEVINNAMHPYTRLLIESVPVINGNLPSGIKGNPPKFAEYKGGCVFADRCEYVSSKCKSVNQEIKYLDENHWSLCDIDVEDIAL